MNEKSFAKTHRSSGVQQGDSAAEISTRPLYDLVSDGRRVYPWATAISYLDSRYDARA